MRCHRRQHTTRKLATELGATPTRAHTFSEASSSSATLRARRTRTRNGTLRIPLDHTNLFRPVSTRTSLVPITFWANFLISATARGARRLAPLRKRTGGTHTQQHGQLSATSGVQASGDQHSTHAQAQTQAQHECTTQQQEAARTVRGTTRNLHAQRASGRDDGGGEF